MTSSRAAGIRLLLCMATGILLLVCSVAAWTLPRPDTGTHRQTGQVGVGPAAVADDPCALVVGPAHEYCRPAAERTGPAAAPRRGGGEQTLWLLLFSTTALAAGIGLALTTGSPRR
ncbi:hypothetical protein AB0M39_36435 [Streptomyces sp. NPDC051907]|uniref:hypothetical protein n=1 Tax=Streptomyces sp. NPDC051907 TaxID=3155284 RepID=UPI0034126941